MAKRITIMIDDQLDKKIRTFQAKKIKESAATYSYSKAINDILKKGV